VPNARLTRGQSLSTCGALVPCTNSWPGSVDRLFKDGRVCGAIREKVELRCFLCLKRVRTCANQRGDSHDENIESRLMKAKSRQLSRQVQLHSCIMPRIALSTCPLLPRKASPRFHSVPCQCIAEDPVTRRVRLMARFRSFWCLVQFPAHHAWSYNRRFERCSVLINKRACWPQLVISYFSMPA